jgi:threonyl-tRNA synthetase
MHAIHPKITHSDRTLAQPREEIIITMPNGSERKGTSWETSPMDVAKELSKSLSERVVIAKVCDFGS